MKSISADPCHQQGGARPRKSGVKPYAVERYAVPYSTLSPLSGAFHAIFSWLQTAQQLLWPLPGAFPEIFSWFQKATLGTSLALKPSPASLAAQQHVLWPLPGSFPEIFSWFQKATLGTSLALNPPRRPWRPSSMPFGHCRALSLRFSLGFRKRR